jgi:hypothetical protein
LYGGFHPNRLDLTALDFTVLGFPFERNVAGRLCSNINHSQECFSSHAIVARPGQGSSIALAQTLLKLCAGIGHFAFWTFDHAAPFGCEQDISSIQNYFSIFDRVGQLPKRLIFAFDDLSKRSQGDRKRINAFQNWCQEYAHREKRNISFLFSLNDEGYSLSPERNTITLNLEEDEERRAAAELHAVLWPFSNA